MNIKVEIEISETAWRKAVADGWNEQYEEEINPDDLHTLDNPDDFIMAIPYILAANIASITIKGAK